MTALVAWMWQGIAVAAAAALLLRAMPRLTAAARHVYWWIVLVLVVLPPWPAAAISVEPVVRQSTAADSVSSAWILLPAPPLWALLAAAGAWAGLLLWRGCRIAWSFHLISALKRESQPFDAARAIRLPLWSRLSASGRPCALRLSDRAAGACALGFRSPVILVPRPLADALSDAELDQVIAHEHAHLLRYDDWLRLLQCVVTSLLGWHPALWIVDRRLDLEREAACDDRVVARTRDAMAYAECLAKVAAVLVGRPRQAPHFVPAAARSASALRSRVNRLVDRPWNGTQRLGRLRAAACMTAVGLLVMAGALPPLVTFADESPFDRARPAPVPAAGVQSPTPIPAALETANVEPARPERAQSPGAVRESLPSRPIVRTVYTPRSAAPDVPTIDTVAEMPGEPVTLDPPARLVSRPAAGSVPPVSVSQDRPNADLPRTTRPETTGQSWAALGSNLATAGTATGKGAQHLGQAIGGWFAKAPWTGKKQSP